MALSPPVSTLAARLNHLRERKSEEHSRVTNVELFFDLVFVFAVTQLSHGLLGHLSALGALQIGILMCAIWWAWIDTAWITNWLNPERAIVRQMLFAMMLLGLVMSASVPKAFDERALAFALAYGVSQVGRSAFMLWALRNHDENNFRNFLRIITWQAVATTVWIGGALAPPELRLPLWGAAVVFESSAPMCGFYVPGLGRSSTADWTVEGGHMAERCSLFVIIALGESILVTGATFSELVWTSETIGAFLVALAGSVAMWVIYFNIGAERATRHIRSTDDPGRLARSGYTYLHILIIAGIIVVAVGDELLLHHPGGHTELKTAIVMLVGPALYLVGNALFKSLTAPHVPLSHLAGLVMFATLIPIVPVLSPLLLSSATTAVLMIVAGWESWSLRRSPHGKPDAATEEEDAESPAGSAAG